MIRLPVFFAVIALSIAAGYFLPPFVGSDPAPATVPEVAAVAPRRVASPARSRADTRRTARLQAQQAHQEEEQKRLTQLERGYVIMEDAEDRSSIIDSISDLETSAIVPALGRLFAIETDPELKEDLLEAVGWGETTDAAKAAIFVTALASDQPKSVRLAAIEGLADLGPEEALPLLRPLAEDSDEEVRAAAQGAIRSFAKP